MKPPSKWHLTGLSHPQKARLSILAREAWEVAKQRGAVDDSMTYDEWRHEQQKEACGLASLKEATQAHFLALRGKWFVILGNLEQAFYDMLNAGEANEARRHMAWRLTGQMDSIAEGIIYRHEQLRREKPGMPALTTAEAAQQAWAYASYICTQEFKCKISELDARGLELLGFTLTNRANAMLRKGSAENRNKSQRAQKRRAKNTPEEPLESGSREVEIPIQTTQIARHEPAQYLC